MNFIQDTESYTKESKVVDIEYTETQAGTIYEVKMENTQGEVVKV